jgi:hypothetical protein
MASWSERVRARALALSGGAVHTLALQRAFCEVASEWADLDCALGAPVASGITAQGDPVEISVALARDANEARLRFIAQPGRPDVPLPADRLFLARRALEFSARRGGVGAASVVAAALELYPCDRWVVSAGNFFLWLGLDFQGSATPRVKLYLNPWASLPEFRGMCVIERFIRMAGFDSGLPALQRLLDFPVAPLVHIVGMNLDDLGIESVKVYFVLGGASVSMLLAIAQAFEGSHSFAVALNRATSNCYRPTGQVHGALVWRRGETGPSFRASLFCPDWFASDADVVLASAAALGGHPPWVARPVKALAAERWFTFLGLDPLGVVLYSRV